MVAGELSKSLQSEQKNSGTFPSPSHTPSSRMTAGRLTTRNPPQQSCSQRQENPVPEEPKQPRAKTVGSDTSTPTKMPPPALLLPE